MARILLTVRGITSRSVAGPGMRFQAMASILAREHDVICVEPDEARLHVDDCDITVATPGLMSASHLACFRSEKRFLVIDLNIPQPVEGLSYFAGIEDGQAKYDTAMRRLRRCLMRGDFFLAASREQRLFWLGALLSTRRMPCSALAGDPFLERLVAVVPSGISEAVPPSQVHSGRRRLLWGGGTWNWTDPLTLIRALHELKKRGRKGLMIHFPGTRHPDRNVPKPRMLTLVKDEVSSLGLDDEVELDAGWSDGKRRLEYLAGAYIGVSLHRAGVEAKLSWRSRILDYVWAGLPSVLTEGCPLAALLGNRGAALIVPPEDVQACADAIENLVLDANLYDSCREALDGLREELAWPNVLEPLSRYCSAPFKAPGWQWKGTDWLRFAIG